MSTPDTCIDLPTSFSSLRPLLAKGAGSVESDRRFARLIASNHSEAVAYFLDEYSMPILNYIAVELLHQSGYDHGKPGECLRGEFFFFIAAPFAQPDHRPGWHPIATYQGTNRARLFSWVAHITRNHFINIRKKEARRGECDLLEERDYGIVVTCDGEREGCTEEEAARLREAVASLSEQDRCVIECLVWKKTHWREAFETLRRYLNPLGPDKAWAAWSFEEKQRAIDRSWDAKTRQDAIAGLKRRAIDHLSKRYRTLKKLGR